MRLADISDWIIAISDTDHHHENRTPKRSRGYSAAGSQPERTHLPSPPAEEHIEDTQMPESPKRRRIIDPTNEIDVTPRPRPRVSALDGSEELLPAASRSQPSGSQSSVSRSSSPSKQIRNAEIQSTGFEIANINDYDLSPSLEALVKDLRRIATGSKLLPKDLQTELTEKDGFFPFHFAEDATQAEISICLPLEQVRLILGNSGYCRRNRHGEASWNIEVHARVLEWVLRTAAGRDGLLDYRYCLDATILMEFKPQNAPSKMVDFCLPIKVNQDEKKVIDNLCRLRPGLSINHTDWGDLVINPIAISIETKTTAGNYDEALLQMGTWLSAQWRSLCYGGQDPQGIEFLPGIIVIGEKWSLLVCVRATGSGKATILQQLSIGSTDSMLGIYTLVASLQRLKVWAETIFWPAFRRNIIDEYG